MSLKLYSFPIFNSVTSDTSTTLYHQTVSGYSELFLTYPFTSNVNLIGTSAILSDESGKKGICSYNYLCPYNVIATYDVPSPEEYFTGRYLNSIEANKFARHQILTFFDNSKQKVGEITVSGLLNQHYSVTSSSIASMSVEYLSNEFSGITEIPSESFAGCSVKTIKFPCNYDNGGVKIASVACTNCFELEKFFCYNSIVSVGDGAFQNCSSLVSNEISCDNSISVSASSISLVEGNDEKHLNVTDLGIVESNDDFANSLKICFDCGKGAFYGCNGITKLYFYNESNTEYINYHYANILNSKVISNGSSIDFYSSPYSPIPYNRGLNKYKIGESAFRYCSGIQEINGYNVSFNALDFNGYYYWSYCAYEKSHYGTSSEENVFFIPKSLDLSDAKFGFSECGALADSTKNITLTFENVSANTKIASGAFAYNKGIKGLSNSGSRIDVENIGQGAFYETGITDKLTELNKIAYGDTSSQVGRIFDTEPQTEP